ncbi:MAG TPA: DUF3105 domain-containing protein [Candidatus Limnocylindrales bacterium]|nr:DUF3105 domain-containing protein [Candidatus Limnocylindrales bacterium]
MAQPDRSGLIRNVLIISVAVAALAIIGFLFLQPPGPTYACTTELTPPAVQEDSSGLGFAAPDLGNAHVAPPGSKITYGYCPPASGGHWNAENRGPIPARVYPPNEERPPGGWVHNLEHGYVAILYRCSSGQLGSGDCATADEMTAMRAWFDARPSTDTCGQQALVARFDSMTTRFAILAWDRLLMLDTLDLAQAETFADQWTDNPALPEAGVC